VGSNRFQSFARIASSIITTPWRYQVRFRDNSQRSMAHNPSQIFSALRPASRPDPRHQRFRESHASRCPKRPFETCLLQAPNKHATCSDLAVQPTLLRRRPLSVIVTCGYIEKEKSKRRKKRLRRYERGREPQWLRSARWGPVLQDIRTREAHRLQASPPSYAHERR
jgi:hypothetical protein